MKKQIKNMITNCGKLFSLFLLHFFFAANDVEAQSFEWAKHFGAANSDAGTSITSDTAGNVYITGGFSDTVDFDPDSGIYNLVSAGSTDIFICKLSASGNLIWAKSMGGVDPDAGTAIAVDDAGNVYIAGLFRDTVDFDPGPASYPFTSQGWDDGFICKLDASGNFVWAKQLGGTGLIYLSAIAVDSSGNVFAHGSFESTVDFDTGPGFFNLTAAGAFDYYIIQLNAAGNFIWAKQIRRTSTIGESGMSFCLDASGNLFFTGSFEGTTDFDPGTGIHALTSTGLNDVFVYKLDISGNFVWAKSFGGSADDAGVFITIDESGNLYITGFFNDTADFDPGPGAYPLASAGYHDVFVCKLDASGNLMWAKKMGGGLVDRGRVVDVDASGNVYTAGRFQGTADFDPGSGTYALTSDGNNEDVFVCKLDSSGNFHWAKSFGGPFADQVLALVADNIGNVYTTGRFRATADFNPSGGGYFLTSAGDFDIFVHKIKDCAASATSQTASACGSYSWNGNTYTTSGTYSDTLPNASGCDSILTLELTINTADTSVTVSNNTLTAAATAAAYQWLDCDNNFSPITNADDASFTATATGNYAVAVTQNSCTDTSACFNVTVTGIFGQDANSFLTVFPNPSSNGLFTISRSDKSIAPYEVKDVTGRTIASGILTEQKTILDLSQTESGVYLLSIGEKTSALIKQ